MSSGSFRSELPTKGGDDTAATADTTTSLTSAGGNNTTTTNDDDKPAASPRNPGTAATAAPPPPTTIEALAASVAGPGRRITVKAACERCRDRRTKCDAQRPTCAACRKKGVACVYVTRDKETRSGANKRKLDEHAHNLDVARRAYDLLAGRDARTAYALFRRIRQGVELEQLVEGVGEQGGGDGGGGSGSAGGFGDPDQHDDKRQQLDRPKDLVAAAAASTSNDVAGRRYVNDAQPRQAFITTLSQSTASLAKIVQLATLVLNPLNDVQLPDVAALGELRHQILSADDLDRLVFDANAPLLPATLLPPPPPPPETPAPHSYGTTDLYRSPSSQDHKPSFDSLSSTHDQPPQPPPPPPPRTYAVPPPGGAYEDGPLHWATAARWTSIPISERAASHLVSVFLSTLNPYWRFLEEDLFLRDMREGSPVHESESESTATSTVAYCTPILVNAVLAAGSMFSDIPEAFVVPGEFVTRGQNFHEEAMRLWRIEERKGLAPSVVGLQSFMILASEGAWRGKDGTGFDMVTTATTMNRLLYSPEVSPYADNEEIMRVRARRVAAAGVVWVHISYAIAFLFGPEKLRVSLHDAPDLRALLPDQPVYWQCYPYRREPQSFRMNRLLLERGTLTSNVWEAIHVLDLGKHAMEGLQQRREFLEAAQGLADRMCEWINWLDTVDGLRYLPDGPFAVVEFYCQVYATQIQLHSQLYEILKSDPPAITEVDHTPTPKSRPGSAHQYASSTTSEADSTFPSYDRDAEVAYREVVRQQLLRITCKVASLLCDFRHTYGYKMPIPFMFQVATLAAFSLLQELNEGTTITTESPTHSASSSRPGDRPSVDAYDPPRRLPGLPAITTAVDAFEETFRCLLACALQIMLPRMICKSISATAHQLRVRLPANVERMMALVAEESWNDGDLDRYFSESRIPNYAIARQQLQQQGPVMSGAGSSSRVRSPSGTPAPHGPTESEITMTYLLRQMALEDKSSSTPQTNKAEPEAASPTQSGPRPASTPGSASTPGRPSTTNSPAPSTTQWRVYTVPKS